MYPLRHRFEHQRRHRRPITIRRTHASRKAFGPVRPAADRLHFLHHLAHSVRTTASAAASSSKAAEARSTYCSSFDSSVIRT